MTNILRETPKPSVRSRALTGVALSAVSLAMTVPAFALAADEASGVSEITVTGSRIKAPNLTSDSPITAVSAEEIKAQGTTNIENLLNNLPSVVGDITNVGYNAGGAANVNLRGLGATRTLVLIDGQRVGPTSAINPAVDLNFIPASLVQSIELLTGGASSVYGSDAIAGVINFHLLKDFEGVMIDSNFTGHQHSTIMQSRASIMPVSVARQPTPTQARSNITTAIPGTDLSATIPQC
jgi:iron complex outermembrane receptor protein